MSFQRYWTPAFTDEVAGGNQTVTPTSISSSEAFGTFEVKLQVEPTGIGSAESFGTFTVKLQVEPTGTPSQEVFGTPVVKLQVEPDSITSVEGFGTPTIKLQVEPDSITSGEAFGTFQANLQVKPDAIASLENFGTPILSQSIVPTGVPSQEAFGAFTVSTEGGAQSVTPTGIASAEAFGTVVVKLQIEPDGVTTAEAFGTPEAQNFTPANVELLTNGDFSSGETGWTFSAGLVHSVVGGVQQQYATAAGNRRMKQSFITHVRAGSPFEILIDLGNNSGVVKSVIVKLDGAITGGGTETIGCTFTLAPGLPLSNNFLVQFETANDWDSFDFYTLHVERDDAPDMLIDNVSLKYLPASDFSVPVCQVAPYRPTGIASLEVVGAPQVNLNINPTGIASAETFGTLILSQSVVPTGIASTETFGTVVVKLQVEPDGVASQETFGTFTVKLQVEPTGIPSQEIFGTLILSQSIVPTGIISAEIFGFFQVLTPLPAAIGVLLEHVRGRGRFHNAKARGGNYWVLGRKEKLK